MNEFERQHLAKLWFHRNPSQERIANALFLKEFSHLDSEKQDALEPIENTDKKAEQSDEL